SCNGIATQSCTYPDNTVSCTSASCSNGKATLAAGCNGAGACPAPVQVDCAPYACGASACKTSCAADDDCVAADWCQSGACAPRLPNGAACTGVNQCSSGFCSDGVCCKSACSGPCDSCNLPMMAGFCAPAPAGSVPSSSCGAYLCNGTLAGCPSSCAVDGDCIAADYCAGGACVPKLAAGSACGAASQCATGFCADGVCCSAACAGPCNVCTKAHGSAADGTCANAPAGAPGNPSCGAYLCS